MSYRFIGSKSMTEIFELCAEAEGLELPSGEFIARLCGAYKIALAVSSALSVVVGLILLLSEKSEYVAIIFLILGIGLFFLLPTLISYKCTVNKESMREEYYILLFKREKKVLWSEVEYKKTKCKNYKSVTFYDKNRKQLISFDGYTVGFERIIKLSNRNHIKKFSKE